MNERTEKAKEDFTEVARKNAINFFNELQELCLKNGIFCCEGSFRTMSRGEKGCVLQHPLNIEFNLERRWPDPRQMTREDFQTNKFNKKLCLVTAKNSVVEDLSDEKPC